MYYPCLLSAVIYIYFFFLPWAFLFALLETTARCTRDKTLGDGRARGTDHIENHNEPGRVRSRNGGLPSCRPS